MKSIDKLTNGDYIASGFNYNNNEEPNEIITSNILRIYKKDGIINELFVHFFYANHHLSKTVKRNDILAIKNPEGKGKISGCIGNYDILNQDKINKILNKKN